NLPWLRPRRKRQRGCGATKQRDELASFHSITASARASSVGEISRPSALAVLRLMTSSNFVASMTGRSAGLAPAKNRPVQTAAWADGPAGGGLGADRLEAPGWGRGRGFSARPP